MSPPLAEQSGMGQVSPGHYEPYRKRQCIFPISFSGTWVAHLHALRLTWGVAGSAHLLSPPLWAGAQKLVVYLQEDVIHLSSGQEAARAQRASQPIPTHSLIRAQPSAEADLAWPGGEAIYWRTWLNSDLDSKHHRVHEILQVTGKLGSSSPEI